MRLHWEELVILPGYSDHEVNGAFTHLPLWVYMHQTLKIIRHWPYFYCPSVWSYEWRACVSSDGLLTSPGWIPHCLVRLQHSLHRTVLRKSQGKQKWMNISLNLSGLRFQIVEIWGDFCSSLPPRLDIHLVLLNPEPAFFFFFFEAKGATLERILHKKPHFKLVRASFT